MPGPPTGPGCAAPSSRTLTSTMPRHAGLIRRFTDVRGRAPAFAAEAPGRVNLIGDHVDYAEGLVLPMAIDRSCLAVADLGGSSNRVRFESLDLGDSFELDLTRPIEPGLHADKPWAAYPIGVLAGYLDDRDPSTLSGLDVLLTSTVPIGSGLSSSAAIELAIATLIEHILGIESEPLDKARLCQRAEQRFAGVPCGLMDQAISELAERNHAMLFDCRSERAESIRMPPSDQLATFVIDTKVRHELASSAYADRRAVCERAAHSLGVRRLRELEPGSIGDVGLLPEDEQRVARHVVSEIHRVYLFAEALRSGRLDQLGPLMAASHRSLRDDMRVSCPELDAVVRAAQTLPETIGVRMTGGGFGGCAVALVDAEAASSFPQRIQMAIGPSLDPDAFPVRASAGARGWVLPPRNREPMR